mmetsp:Transcript_45620/g.111039  ORF Transcript_45620/g.111039 Transcript_45620/m.111039 type:complete len:639 (+) Transcript_45620:243-2159(+)
MLERLREGVRRDLRRSPKSMEAEADEAPRGLTSGKGAKRRTKEAAALKLLELIDDEPDDWENDPESNGKRKRSPQPAAGPQTSEKWVTRVLDYVHRNGLDLLAQVCGRYKLAYDGDFTAIPPAMQEQVAHCILFNPALYKNGAGLPVSLRDCKGVTGFKLAFLQDPDSVVRNIRISCELQGEPFSVDLRACSNCGSCFSGRFMDSGAHQRAGGWKEITERISAGKHSWGELKGWRLCVPCFVNWGIKGTTENGKRSSINQVLEQGNKDIIILKHDGSAAAQPANAAKKARKSEPAAPARNPKKRAAAGDRRADQQPNEYAKMYLDKAPSTRSAAGEASVPRAPKDRRSSIVEQEEKKALDRRPLLVQAASSGDTKEVQRLLDEGEDIMAVDKQSGATCLHVAANDGCLSTVKLLCEKGGMDLMFIQDKAGKTALHRATDGGFLDVVRYLLEAGGDELLFVQARIGQTCLHNAASGDQLDVARLLVTVGGKRLLCMPDEIGATCLHWAVEGNLIKMSQYLAEQGGVELIMQQDQGGKTCMHRAVDEGCNEVLAELLADMARIAEEIHSREDAVSRKELEIASRERALQSAQQALSDQYGTHADQEIKCDPGKGAINAPQQCSGGGDGRLQAGLQASVAM